MTLPAVRVPQFMELRVVVHALFAYTPMFADVDTVPLDDKFVDALSAAKVVSVRAIPIMINAIMAVVIDIFLFVVIFPC